MNRLRFWRAAAEMAVDHPLTGVGFGGSNWVALSSQYLPGGNDGGHFVHNNYLQILVDSGFPALAFFLALLLASFWWLNRQRRRWKTTLPDLAILCGALQASLLGFAIGSTFLSRVAYDFIYILLMTVAALHNVGRSLDAAPAPEVAPATAQPAPVALAPPPPPAVPAPEPRMRLRGLLRGPR
jgi:O-antigen ligase